MDNYDKLCEQLSSTLDIVKSIVSEKLNNYGIYCRIFARIKKGSSIRRKLSQARYLEDSGKNIQDLLGVRVVLYYKDDIRVCKKIFERMLEPANLSQEEISQGSSHLWEEYESSDETFTATKINGVFLLPGFVRKVVEPYINGLRIDPTFEIQLRTMFFEGWHEVEHDLRYKKLDIWDDFPKESRKLNSVLATLEMCDQYMVTVFDDIGHDFYKNEDYGQMIQYKYRLKTLNGELDSKIEHLISKELAKRIFKSSKENFIDIVLDRSFNRLDANIIVYLVNESLKGTEEYIPEIAERFQTLFEEEKILGKKTYNASVARIKRENAFGCMVDLRIGASTEKMVFMRTAGIIYDYWLKRKLQEVIPQEFEGELHPFSIKLDGTACSFIYNEENCELKLKLKSIDINEPGKIWETSAEIKRAGTGLQLICRNEMLKPENAAKTVMPFSCPTLYTKIAQDIGVIDVYEVHKEIIDVTVSNIDKFFNLIYSEKRLLPVILITYASPEECLQKNSCYGRLVDYVTNPRYSEQNNLMRKVSYVCHVYRATGTIAEIIAQRLHENAAQFRNGIRFFKNGYASGNPSAYQFFSEAMVEKHPKDLYALNTRAPYYYMSVSGADAMRHEIIQMVYKENLEVQLHN